MNEEAKSTSDEKETIFVQYQNENAAIRTGEQQEELAQDSKTLIWALLKQAREFLNRPLWHFLEFIQLFNFLVKL
jgi:hypothetical protein